MFYSLLATNSSSNVVDRLNGAEKIFTTIESQNGMSSIGIHSAIFPGFNFFMHMEVMPHSMWWTMVLVRQVTSMKRNHWNELLMIALDSAETCKTSIQIKKNFWFHNSAYILK